MKISERLIVSATVEQIITPASMLLVIEYVVFPYITIDGGWNQRISNDDCETKGTHITLRNRSTES